MTNLILLTLIAGIVGSAIWYICREKRRGVTCIGCPDAHSCSGNCAGCKGCKGCCGSAFQ